MTSPQPPRVRPSRVRFGVLVVGLGLLLAACAENAPQDTLEPEGPISRQIDDLVTPIFWVAIVIGLAVLAAILYASWAFRRSRQGEDYIPPQIHGNTRLEIGWTIAPAVLLAVIAVPTVSTILDLADRPADAMDVTVYGAQWWWEYEYPSTSTRGPVVTANELHIPIDQPVHLTMTSRDVIHSYWVPKLAGKKDVVPGRWHTLTIQADEPGEYFGQCVEFCGASHANMRLRVIAHTPDEFEDWLDHNAADRTAPPAGSLEATGEDLITAKGCTTCHVLRGVSTADQIEALRGRLIRVDGDPTPFAPDLTHVGSRGTFAGSLFDLNIGELKAWLRNPPERKDGSLMPNLNLTEDEIDALANYLLSLD